MPADGLTVLVVEDEGLIRLTVAESLRDAGFAVTEASNGDGTLTLLNRDDTVALVISDIEMPGSIDGLGLAGWLRREMPHVVVVLEHFPHDVDHRVYPACLK
jgi:CheY-like chemotaxis protein